MWHFVNDLDEDVCRANALVCCGLLPKVISWGWNAIFKAVDISTDKDKVIWLSYRNISFPLLKKSNVLLKEKKNIIYTYIF